MWMAAAGACGASEARRTHIKIAPSCAAPHLPGRRHALIPRGLMHVAKPSSAVSGMNLGWTGTFLEQQTQLIPFFDVNTGRCVSISKIKREAITDRGRTLNSGIQEQGSIAPCKPAIPNHQNSSSSSELESPDSSSLYWRFSRALARSDCNC